MATTLRQLPGFDSRLNGAGIAPGGRWGLFYDGYDLVMEESRLWDKSLPYQLLILEEQADDGSHVIAHAGNNRSLKFTLPIPPEALTITTPFAISGSVTLNGYVEQHGGVPIKMISFSGTTGVLPTRASADHTDTTNLLGAVFAGTISSANRLSATLGLTSLPSTIYDSQFSDVDPTKLLTGTTGYYQFRLLQRFLEGYAATKLTTQGAKWRLAFASWKDSFVYLCTPIAFSLKRSVDSPLEYKYDIQLKAFKRISITELGLAAAGIAARDLVVATRDPNPMASIFNNIQRIRTALQQVSPIISGVSADIDNSVFRAAREGVGVAKDALSIATTALDLPDSIIKNLKFHVIDQFKALKNRVTNFGQEISQASDQLRADISTLSSAADEHRTSPITVAHPTAHPVHDIFDNPQAHPEILDRILPSQLVLPAAVQAQLGAERDRIRGLKRKDFENHRDTLTSALADYANAVGAGHATYNEVYGITNNKVARTTPSNTDYDILALFNELVIEVSKLAAHIQLTGAVADPLGAFARLATMSSIPFTVPTSRYAVPMLYDHSLEDMALLYLGDSNRWMEIAALNGLREPYIDEVGYKLPLLVNAHGNTVLVADSTNLAVGQLVWIQANTVPREQHSIVSITKFATGIISVVLDGTPVDAFTLQVGSSLQVFAPHTTNSQSLIYIPSTKPATQNPTVKTIDGVNDLDHLLAVGGVDLLLSPTRDLIITPDGDGRWAFGLTNIVQQASLIVNTPKGSLYQHSLWGFPVIFSKSNAEQSAQEIAIAANEAFQSDPTYTGVTSAQVLKNGPLTQVVLSLGIAGTNGTVPIAMDLLV